MVRPIGYKSVQDIGYFHVSAEEELETKKKLCRLYGHDVETRFENGEEKKWCKRCAPRA